MCLPIFEDFKDDGPLFRPLILQIGNVYSVTSKRPQYWMVYCTINIGDRRQQPLLGDVHDGGIVLEPR